MQKTTARELRTNLKRYLESTQPTIIQGRGWRPTARAILVPIAPYPTRARAALAQAKRHFAEAIKDANR
jgi:hypothetical protein